ncbi:hypothetical protein ACHAXS_010197 [Conticribra weissflogii]
MDWFYKSMTTKPATNSVAVMPTSISQSVSDDCVEVVIQSTCLNTSNEMQPSIAIPRRQTSPPPTFARKPLAVASPLALSVVAHAGNTSSSSSASNTLKNVLPSYLSDVRRPHPLKLKSHTNQSVDKENEFPSMWRDGYLTGTSKQMSFTLADIEICEETFSDDEDSLSVSTTSGVSNGAENKSFMGIGNQPLHPLQQSPNNTLKLRQSISEGKLNKPMNTHDFSIVTDYTEHRPTSSTNLRQINLLPRIAAVNFQQKLEAESSIETLSQSLGSSVQSAATQEYSTNKSRMSWKHINNYPATPMTPRRQSLAQKCLFDALESMQSRYSVPPLKEVDENISLDTAKPGITSPTSYIGTIIDFECHKVQQTSMVEDYHSDNDNIPHFHNSVSLSCEEGSDVDESNTNLVEKFHGNRVDYPQNDKSKTAHEALIIQRSGSCISSLSNSGSTEEGGDDQPDKIGVDDNAMIGIHTTMSNESMDSQNTADEQRDKISPLPGAVTFSSQNSPTARSSATSSATSAATSSATSAASDLFSFLRKQNQSAHDAEGIESEDSSIPKHEGHRKSAPSLNTNKSASPSEPHLLSSQISSAGKYPSKDVTSVTKPLKIDEKSDSSMPKHHDAKSNSRFSFLASALVATKFLKSPSPQANSTLKETSVCESDSSTPKATGRTSPGKRGHHYLQHDSCGSTTTAKKRRNTGQKRSPQPVDFEQEGHSSISCATFSNKKRIAIRQREVDNKKKESIVRSLYRHSSASTAGFSISETLDISSMASRSYDDETSQTRDELARLSDRVRMLEERLPDVGEDTEEITKLRDHLHYLGEELSASKESNKEMEEKLDEIFNLLEEEIRLKESAQQKAFDLTLEIDAIAKTKNCVEECLGDRIKRLESQLEQMKRANADYEDMKNELTAKNSKLDELKKLNSSLCEMRAEIESELRSSKKENESLREKLLALKEESNIKENTLSAALAELKSLSEEQFKTQEELRNERERRQDEVSSLQFSLDDISTEMLKMSQKTHDLECENDELKLELRRIKSENESSNSMRRAARGY